MLAERLTLEFPAGKYVQVWSPNHKPTITETDGERTYHWNVPQLVTAPKAATRTSKKAPAKGSRRGWRWAQVAIGGMDNISQLGGSGGLVSQAWRETQAQPDRCGARPRRGDYEERRRRRKIRCARCTTLFPRRIAYVGIDFGIGRYRPHAAARGFGEPVRRLQRQGHVAGSIAAGQRVLDGAGADWRGNCAGCRMCRRRPCSIM